MLRCNSCAYYRSGGKCQNIHAKNGGYTCPLQTAGDCYHPLSEPIPDEPVIPYVIRRIPKSQKVGIGARLRPVKPDEYARTKVCIRCGKSKPIVDFYRRTRSKDGRMSMCKECQNESMRLSKLKRKAEQNKTTN